jgi:hypothetical protein
MDLQTMKNKKSDKETSSGNVGRDMVTTHGDVYNVENAIGVGRKVNIRDANIEQTQMQSNAEIDLEVLARELDTLRRELKARASIPEHDIAIGIIAAAQSEAQKGDRSKTREYLARAGSWVAEIASKNAVPVAIEALKNSMLP